MFGKVGLCTSLALQTAAGSSVPVHAIERPRYIFRRTRPFLGHPWETTVILPKLTNGPR
ncbi:uncharacterized protein METZ01_LOCUS214939, partial [marine metagenome]